MSESTEMKKKDGVGHTALFSQLRSLAREVDTAMGQFSHQLGRELDLPHSRKAENASKGLVTLVKVREDLKSTKEEAKQQLETFRESCSTTNKLQMLLGDVLQLQASRLEKVESFIEKYGYKRPVLSSKQDKVTVNAGTVVDEISGENIVKESEDDSSPLLSSQESDTSPEAEKETRSFDILKPPVPPVLSEFSRSRIMGGLRSAGLESENAMSQKGNDFNADLTFRNFPPTPPTLHPDSTLLIQSLKKETNFSSGLGAGQEAKTPRTFPCSPPAPPVLHPDSTLLIQSAKKMGELYSSQEPWSVKKDYMLASGKKLEQPVPPKLHSDSILLLGSTTKLRFTGEDESEIDEDDHYMAPRQLFAGGFPEPPQLNTDFKSTVLIRGLNELMADTDNKASCVPEATIEFSDITSEQFTEKDRVLAEDNPLVPPKYDRQAKSVLHYALPPNKPKLLSERLNSDKDSSFELQDSASKASGKENQPTPLDVCSNKRSLLARSPPRPPKLLGKYTFMKT